MKIFDFISKWIKQHQQTQFEQHPQIQVKARIERGITKIIVPHENDEIIFIYPPFDPDSYQEVGKQILEKGYRLPIGDEIVSLLHAAYCSEFEYMPEFKNIKKIIIDNGLWIYNRNLWTHKGVYIVQDPEARGLSEKFGESDLEKILKNGEEINGIRFSEDKRVRFAPKSSYSLIEGTTGELIRSYRQKSSQNGFFIASFGIDGAEKLEEVAEQFKYYEYAPVVYGFEIKNEQVPKLRVSALGYFGKRFCINGDHVGIGFEPSRQQSFGVLR